MTETNIPLLDFRVTQQRTVLIRLVKRFRRLRKVHCYIVTLYSAEAMSANHRLICKHVICRPHNAHASCIRCFSYVPASSFICSVLRFIMKWWLKRLVGLREHW